MVVMKKKTVQEWDDIGKHMLGALYETSQESKQIQQKLDSGEFTNVCSNVKEALVCSNVKEALPFDVVEKYTKPMKW